MEREEVVIGGRTLSLETGKLAGLAHGAVTVRYGDTMILATATVADKPREGIDFFPLTVDFEERLYAAGKIPGGFTRREGRPTEQAILTARLTDRPIRPLFPKGSRNDVQVIVTALSVDQENAPDILSIIGASAALSISPIPFDGPVGAVRVGFIDGNLVINPTASQIAQSLLDLVVAGTEDAVVMVEAGAKELPEDKVLEAIRFGHAAIQNTIAIQKRLVERVGQPKSSFTVYGTPQDLKERVANWLGDKLREVVFNPDKSDREASLEVLKQQLIAELSDTSPEKDLAEAFEGELKKVVREAILTKGLRPDGRDPKTIRPVSCEVGLLPRTHGSGLFTRGQTQVLTIATLGSSADEQRLDGLGLEESKRFMHHYSFPPFSTGETKPLRGPGRREIGHGALAERAIAAVIPSEGEFPYTIRLVSEVLSSNGSTSMASVCGSTLALMDAGVPIQDPVAGVAMGLVSGENGQFVVLTDIQGMEDALGDMDFKVAGTAKGITALQMDMKVKGLTHEVLDIALAQAREGRLFILGKMLDSISASRPELSRFAPRIYRLTIPVDKIGALIGPGGRTIRSIQEGTGAELSVEDDGTVFVSAKDNESSQRAIELIKRWTREVELNGIYNGKVTRITNFGVFVEILPGKEGLVRLGELAEYPVRRAEDVVSVGDEIMIMVIEIDSQGRINLSRRAVLEGTTGTPPSRPPSRGLVGSGNRGPSPYRGGPRPGPRNMGGQSERRGPMPERRPRIGTGADQTSDRKRWSPGPGELLS